MNEINEFIKKYEYNVDRKYLELLWPLYGKDRNSKWVDITDEIIKLITGFNDDCNTRNGLIRDMNLINLLEKNIC
jgi:hypothetical protein